MRDPGNEVGIVIGAFRSILHLSILMLTKQIFQSCWSFLADQKYDFVSLHNMIDREFFEIVASIDSCLF